MSRSPRQSVWVLRWSVAMMPWGHAAVGYVLYSLGCRSSGREPPSGTETVALLFATQVPDLVDKPLSWGLGWFPTGHAIAHSAFVAVPAGIATAVLAARLGYLRIGAAALVGYWSHLVADVLGPLRSGRPPAFGIVLWPLSDPTGYDTEYGLWRGVVYVERFVDGLLAAEPVILLSYLLLPVVALVVWLLDGAPGLIGLRRYLSPSS